MSLIPPRCWKAPVFRRPRAHQDGSIVGLYARRSALGWTRSAGRRLLLLQPPTAKRSAPPLTLNDSKAPAPKDNFLEIARITQKRKASMSGGGYSWRATTRS